MPVNVDEVWTMRALANMVRHWLDAYAPLVGLTRWEKQERPDWNYASHITLWLSGELSSAEHLELETHVRNVLYRSYDAFECWVLHIVVENECQ